MKRSPSIVFFRPLLFLLFLAGGCKKFVEIDPPITRITEQNAYSTDATAASVLTGMYVEFSQDQSYGAGVNMSRTFFYCGLMADELSWYDPASTTGEMSFYRNDLRSTGPDWIWSNAYTRIYKANAAIEGITASTGLTQPVKEQLLGEAKFMRAFLYFQLVNYYGRVPLALTTNYTVNANLPRAAVEDVYAQMVTDLKEASQLLKEDYLNGAVNGTTTERVRPNKWTAKALLARVYLYQKNYADAASTAGEVIAQHDKYDLSSTPLDQVFLKNSKETIWTIASVMGPPTLNSVEGQSFVLTSTGPTKDYPVYLSNFLVNEFEPGDQRKAQWIAYAAGYPYANKYRAGRLATVSTESTIYFRIAEQYLIRAEAEIMLNHIPEGIADLNIIRRRATDLTAPPGDQLPALSTGLSQDAAMDAVMHERMVELFTEWGHRWLDLKRTGRLDARMQTVTPAKGSLQWRPSQAFFPIPQNQLQGDPAMTNDQNPGYGN